MLPECQYSRANGQLETLMHAATEVGLRWLCGIGMARRLQNVTDTPDEVVATQGTWIEARIAIIMLEALMTEIRSEDIRFGLLC
jgi:hypothetical protein